MTFSKIRPVDRFAMVAASMLGIAVVIWLGRSLWQEAILLTVLTITGVHNLWVGMRDHKAARRSERD